MNQFDIGTKVFIDDVEYVVHDMIYEIGQIQPLMYWLSTVDTKFYCEKYKMLTHGDILFYNAIQTTDYTIRHERIE
jgi:hypothetical protein